MFDLNPHIFSTSISLQNQQAITKTHNPLRKRPKTNIIDFLPSSAISTWRFGEAGLRWHHHLGGETERCAAATDRTQEMTEKMMASIQYRFTMDRRWTRVKRRWQNEPNLHSPKPVRFVRLGVKVDDCLW